MSSRTALVKSNDVPVAQELDKLAKQKSTEILRNINEVNKRIKAAKEKVVRANDMETGWWGKTGEKTTANSEALVQIHEAILSMSMLIQQSIIFTCSSIEFARVMHRTMARLMSTGFKDVHGNIVRLTGTSRDFASLILDEAENFVKNQDLIEKKQVELAEMINDHDDRFNEKENLDKEQTDRIDQINKILEKHETNYDRHHQRLNKIDDLLSIKESLDGEQTERLDYLQQLIQDKSSVDEKQENSIRVLLEYMQTKEYIDKVQQSEIDTLKSSFTKHRYIIPSFIISIISLLTAIIAIMLTKQ